MPSNKVSYTANQKFGKFTEYWFTPTDPNNYPKICILCNNEEQTMIIEKDKIIVEIVAEIVTRKAAKTIISSALSKYEQRYRKIDIKVQVPNQESK